ncbi:hypothetical protein BJV78DRAFT_1194238, partial [Lactifluus subvellereus]
VLSNVIFRFSQLAAARAIQRSLLPCTSAMMRAMMDCTNKPISCSLLFSQFLRECPNSTDSCPCQSQRRIR